MRPRSISILIATLAAVLLLGWQAGRAQQPAWPSASPSAQAPSAPDRGQSPRASVVSPHGPLALHCENCHTFTSWKPIRAIPEFDHSKTRYPLRGMHTNVACTHCHTKLVFTDVGKSCADCHADIHRGSNGKNCAQCHTVNGWNVSLKQINEHFNRFPLVGAHATVQCDDCHKAAAAGQFQGLSTTCYTCHAKDAKFAPIDHTTFPADCTACHSMDSWFGAKFDHLKFTGFALTGMHATLDCAACHVNNKFAGTPANCMACHTTDWNGTTNPSHIKAKFPTDCAVCHSTSNWTSVTFNHAQYTGFALTGAHANLDCNSCHAGGNFNNTPATCSSCHMKDYNGTTNPNHVTAGFPTDCSMCHSTTAWQPSSFNHSTTPFPLTGAHVNTPCASCHVNGNYSGSLPTACSGCHTKDYNSTTSPNHQAAGFPMTCDVCHSTTAWQPASFNHNNTSFPLTGAHIPLQCTACHVNNNYTTLPTTCSGCHLTDYNSTTNPNHKSAGFPMDCTVCHTTTGWTPASFDHSTTGFPLTGAHTSLQCASCHVNGNYNLSSNLCSSCHMTDYNGTTNPNHASAGFPTTCDTCHSTTSWAGATFNHNNTPFPLTGAHVNTPCTSCHVNNVFAGTPTDCYSCHKAAYTGTTNPNHVAAMFPTTCQTCHTTTSWAGATFNHTWFPIYSGTHAGRWTSCADCHVNSSDYAVFSCITCHTHSKANTDPHHQGVSGYVYNATSCYQCHRNGTAGD